MKPVTRLACLLFVLGSAAIFADQSKPWPPGIQKVAPESPVLTPEAEMQTFYMPPGYHVELVAAEPLIQDPIAIDFDPQGRLWAIEMPTYMEEINPSNEFERQPRNRIVVLEDTNRDGRMDKRTVFMEGLVLPHALKVLEHGVLVGEPPNLWFVHDTNGDLKADSKELVTTTYGRLDAALEHNANSLFWALDNWIYTSEVDTFLRWKNGAFEVKKALARGQWGATQDDAGRIYRNTNESVLHVDVVPTPYYQRHPNLLRTRGSYESLEGENNEVNTVWPVRPTPGVNRGYQDGVLRPDGSLARFTAVCSPIVYRGDRLPAELYGNVFVAEPAANVVSRIIIDQTRGELLPRKAYDNAEFLASTDERFRPVYLSNAPDGTMYIVDMYRGIIQHKVYITEYLRDQILSRDLTLPVAKGRIYRVVHDTTRRDTATLPARPSTSQLVDRLSHPNGWWRDMAQQLLVEREDQAAVPALKKLADDAKDTRTRLHALWTLDGIDAIEPPAVIKALDDPSRDIRTSALRLSERWLTPVDAAMQAAVLKRLDDPDPMVRRQLAATLGTLPAGPRETAVASVLERYGSDPIVIDAAISGLRGSEIAVLQNLLKPQTETPQLTAAITMIAGTIVRGAQDAAMQTLFQWIGDDARPMWQRSALMRGGEVALLNAAMPGTPQRGRGAGAAANPNAPCPTCPGGRQGPGGASAFPQTRAGGAGAAAPAGRAGAGRAGAGATSPEVAGITPAPAAGRGGGRGSGAPVTRLRREPALVALADRDKTELGQRATALLARLEWPGKPGATVITPLTPEEEKRFADGEQIYQNICKACHQADGRGQEKVAATLIGSPIALAPSGGVPARALLNGKEGTVGLMPPLGATLTDDQIAAVLTYIRREWGHTAAPVDPSTIRDTREATVGRTRPWTNDELLALIK
jgi:mono/diheme cytochrome c family protein/glucose/arabinose dehydrogenase/HEAT repeat protein